jgi:hypothetical protein
MDHAITITLSSFTNWDSILHTVFYFGQLSVSCGQCVENRAAAAPNLEFPEGVAVGDDDGDTLELGDADFILALSNTLTMVALDVQFLPCVSNLLLGAARAALDHSPAVVHAATAALATTGASVALSAIAMARCGPTCKIHNSITLVKSSSVAPSLLSRQYPDQHDEPALECPSCSQATLQNTILVWTDHKQGSKVSFFLSRLFPIHTFGMPDNRPCSWMRFALHIRNNADMLRLAIESWSAAKSADRTLPTLQPTHFELIRRLINESSPARNVECKHLSWRNKVTNETCMSMILAMQRIHRPCCATTRLLHSM